MRSASMSFLVYSLLLGICLIYSNASEYFTRTTQNLTPWHNLHPTFHGELSLLSCAMTCGMDRSCLGIGHSMSPNQQCVLFIFNQADDTGNHYSHHNLTYYLRDDIGKYLICAQREILRPIALNRLMTTPIVFRYLLV